jgi:hypothetical protein
MATKTFYVTRDMKHPLYKTRMLRAGDQLQLDGPTARLYTALKAISLEAPARAKVATAPVAPEVPVDTNTLSINGEAVAKVTTKRKSTKRRAAKKAK